MARNRANKKAKNKSAKHAGKKPKNLLDPNNAMNLNLAWHFRKLVLAEDSEWSWSNILEINMTNPVFQKLREYETMKLSEVNDKKNHRIPYEDLSKKAQNELERIKLNDIDALHSFHIVGNVRFYCIPFGNIMQLLWYDPYHDNVDKAVCPYHKKGT
jgi:hypothetical protein